MIHHEMLCSHDTREDSEEDDIVAHVRNSFLSAYNVEQVQKHLEKKVHERVGATFLPSDDTHRLVINMRQHALDRLGLVVGETLRQVWCETDEQMMRSESVLRKVTQISLTRMNIDVVAQLADDVVEALEHLRLSRDGFERRESNYYAENLDALTTQGNNSISSRESLVLKEGMLGVPYITPQNDALVTPSPWTVGEAWTHTNPALETEHGRLRMW